MNRGRSIRLAAARWPELPTRPLVLVPVGSTEQHGPHLPVSTDTVIVAAVATAAADSVGDAPGAPVVVAPAINYGASGEHQSFPGTVSVGHEALNATLFEVMRSLSTWAGRVVFVNGHGGNLATMRAAVPQLRAEGHNVAWAPCIVSDAAARGLPVSDAHAGRWETSLMLHLRREAVLLPLPPAGDTRPIGKLVATLTKVGVKAISPSGILGDPTGASGIEGARLLAAMVDELALRLRTDRVDQYGMLARPIDSKRIWRVYEPKTA